LKVRCQCPPFLFTCLICFLTLTVHVRQIGVCCMTADHRECCCALRSTTPNITGPQRLLQTNASKWSISSTHAHFGSDRLSSLEARLRRRLPWVALSDTISRSQTACTTGEPNLALPDTFPTYASARRTLDNWDTATSTLTSIIRAHAHCEPGFVSFPLDIKRLKGRKQYIHAVNYER
jgi:hypothetical protein